MLDDALGLTQCTGPAEPLVVWIHLVLLRVSLEPASVNDSTEARRLQPHAASVDLETGEHVRQVRYTSADCTRIAFRSATPSPSSPAVRMYRGSRRTAASGFIPCACRSWSIACQPTMSMATGSVPT